MASPGMPVRLNLARSYLIEFTERQQEECQRTRRGALCAHNGNTRCDSYADDARRQHTFSCAQSLGTPDYISSKQRKWAGCSKLEALLTSFVRGALECRSSGVTGTR